MPVSEFTHDVQSQRRRHVSKVQIMGHSSLMKENRDEQRDELMRKSPAERLQIALELSDACALINAAARKALEEKRAIAKA
jgi:hypothetical protein